MSEKRYLECQTCGDFIRALSLAEAQVVASYPYDYIVYCREHSDDWEIEARREGLL